MGDGPKIMVDELRVWGGGTGFWKGRKSSHLTVDGRSPSHINALHRFAQAIGLRLEWFQVESRVPHYDLTESKRRAAVEAGAVFVPAKKQARERLQRTVWDLSGRDGR